MANDLDIFNNVIGYIVEALSIISILGAFLVILTFSIFKDIRTFPIKLIVNLCWTVLFGQVFFLLSFALYDTFLCIPCAMIIHYFFLSMFFWSFCIAFNFYRMIVKRDGNAEKKEKVYKLVCWGIPYAIVIIIAGVERYGDIGGFCYMNSGIAVFAAFFLPGLILISANTVLFFFVAREIHDTMSQAPQSERREKSTELRVYVSIFVSIGLSWIFGYKLYGVMSITVNRFLMAIFPSNNVGALILLVVFSLTAPLQGFLIFISYCLNTKVLSRWAGLLGQFIPVFRRYNRNSAAADIAGGRHWEAPRLQESQGDLPEPINIILQVL